MSSEQADLAAAPEHSSVWSRPPLLWIRLGYLTLLNALFSASYRLVRSNYRVWRWSAARYGPRLDRLARLHAYLMCAWAKKRVPAYGRFLREEGHVFRLLALESFPETSKDNYVKRYGFAERCRHGRIPLAGTVVDESAGSSGTPHNWVRSARELRDVHVNTANWVRDCFPTERLFAVNAFSMGAWATGTNMAVALSRVAMVKSTGPDLEKVVDTLASFGADYDYVIAAYPPFLKRVVDALDERGYDWGATRVYGLVGGESMTEAMRDYLERRLVKVRSGYGASDLQIGIGGETDLSVWVRRLFRGSPDARAAILGEGEDRVPMVFQYNPLENYVEINDRGEAVVTVNNFAVLSPRLRYNVGDEARIMRRDELVRRLRELGLDPPLDRSWGLPFLFLFGRRDSTVSYMGANIYPTDVEYGLYHDERLAGLIESFCLQLDEGEGVESRPVVHVQLRPGAAVDRTDAERRLGESLVAHLSAASRDFAESVREDPSAGRVRVQIHDHGTGPFAGQSGRIKNVYVLP